MINLAATGLVVMALCCIVVVLAIAIFVPILLFFPKGKSAQDSEQIIDVDYEDISG